MTWRPILTATAATVATCVSLSACGVSTEGAMGELGAPGAQGTSPALRAVASERPSGQVAIDRAGPSLTARAVERYRADGGTGAIQLGMSDEATALQRLCDGDIDIADGGRALTSDELARCGSQGRTPVQFTVAVDAVVLATRAEYDLGTDCIDLERIREIFRAGSPIYDWSQLRLPNAAVQVGGPKPGTSAFALFGQTALDTVAPSLTDVRSDYRPGTSGRVLAFVAGEPADAVLATREPQAAEQLRAAERRATAARASVSEATQELVAARRDRRKGIADGRSATQQARDRMRVSRGEAARSRARAVSVGASRELVRAQRRAAQTRAALRRQEALRGRVVILGYRDAAIAANQLRVIEVSQRSGAAASCSYPSVASIASGDYPLSRQLVLTTTTAGLTRPEVRGLLTTYFRHARALAREADLLPVPQRTIDAHLAALPDQTTP